MTNQIHFELVSPEERLVSEQVSMAVVPGAEGELGVGAGHAAFVVALKPGAVTLYMGGDADGNTNEGQRKIFIAGGFADITGAQCTVLAEQAVNVSDLDQNEIEKNIADLNEDLASAEAGAAAAKIEAALVIEHAKITAITGKFSA